jgi:hypothetical protein
VDFLLWPYCYHSPVLLRSLCDLPEIVNNVRFMFQCILLLLCYTFPWLCKTFWYVLEHLHLWKVYACYVEHRLLHVLLRCVLLFTYSADCSSTVVPFWYVSRLFCFCDLKSKWATFRMVIAKGTYYHFNWKNTLPLIWLIFNIRKYLSCQIGINLY